MLKKPTGNNLKDGTKQGFQESGIHESVIYGGIFMEDSAGGVISKSAGGFGRCSWKWDCDYWWWSGKWNGEGCREGEGELSQRKCGLQGGC
jgi:hypothetical protein